MKRRNTQQELTSISTQIVHSRSHVQLIQHGVCISSLRTQPGPSQSVSDILAALIQHFTPSQLALLGFAAGGILPPLELLQNSAPIQAIDLDQHGFDLFQKTCPQWASRIDFHHQDAVEWLKRQRRRFPMIIDDLSIPIRGDVFKPDVSWTLLPPLIRQKLAPSGTALFNMLPHPGTHPRASLQSIAQYFPSTLLIELRDYENRLLIGGNQLPSARTLGIHLRRDLRRMKSLFADQITIRHFSTPSAA